LASVQRRQRSVHSGQTVYSSFDTVIVSGSCHPQQLQTNNLVRRCDQAARRRREDSIKGGAFLQRKALLPSKRIQIQEIIDTGDLQRIKYEKTADVESTTLFMGIYGVGLQTAYQWYNVGCRTLKDVRERKGGIQLSKSQQIGLQFYDGAAIALISSALDPIILPGSKISTRECREKKLGLFSISFDLSVGADSLRRFPS
jgi:hypothetical protein